jgi:GT2 family glycosyltransferase
MNNDMKVADSQWLRELTQWALLPEIGVVTGKLLHTNKTIQHAGIVIGMQGFMGHLYLNAPDHYFGLLGSVDWYRNVSAVTGACQMMRRSVFEELGGYDEEYQLVFSDIQFCLRAIQKGYRNLYDPFVALIHNQGQSRGYQTPIKDIARAYEQWEEWLQHDDPYFSPNLTYTNIPQCQLESMDPKARYQRVVARRDMVLKQLKTQDKALVNTIP